MDSINFDIVPILASHDLRWTYFAFYEEATDSPV